MSSRRQRQGFTLIELVLAIAITALLGTCVYSVTQSMSATARRQQEAAGKQARRDRFEELLRRDLRGWLPSKSAPQAQKQAESPDNLTSFQFNTSADSLSGTLSPAQMPIMRSSNVQYVVRKAAEKFEIARVETSNGTAQSNIVLYQSDAEIVIDFFDGGKWLAHWTGNDRPKAARVTMGNDGFVVRL